MAVRHLDYARLVVSCSALKVAIRVVFFIADGHRLSNLAEYTNKRPVGVHVAEHYSILEEMLLCDQLDDLERHWSQAASNLLISVPQ